MFVHLGTAVAAALLLASGVAPGSLAAAPRASAPISASVGARPGEALRASLPLTTYAGGSTVVEEELYSPILDLHTSYRVMLPPDYATSSRQYPVLYMLHGVAGDSSEWQSIGILEAADRMMQRGEIDPFLIVLPNGGANYWVNQATGARWADYVAQDVVRQVDREYRTVMSAQARAIGGLSMGGEGALRIAMTNPGVFGTAAAHSPSLRTAFDQLAPELQPLFGDAETWRTVTPLWLVLDSDSGYGLNMAIDVGEDDPWRANVELLHQRMQVRGMAHRFEVLPGEHAAEYWIDNVDHYLSFYASSLSSTAENGPALDAY
jgi:enterochelin esterase-like enzyme